VIKELRESQKKDKVWVPYGRLLSEIFHQGGMLKALSETHYFADEMLEIVTGKVINAKTLKNMQLIKKVTPLSSDISESMVYQILWRIFPPYAKRTL